MRQCNISNMCPLAELNDRLSNACKISVRRIMHENHATGAHARIEELKPRLNGLIEIHIKIHKRKMFLF